MVLKQTKHIYKHKIKRKVKKSEEPKLETWPQHYNSLELDFDYSLPSIYSQPNQRWGSKLRSQRSRLE